ncbi:MAG: hypothetical protein INF93_18865 [Rhodobacter sp.]|jgi:hypothetical protein|nr:hypothetical protein [Rhodobacter sp.]
MTLLSDRLLEPDVVNLDEAEAAAVLNAPDPDLPLKRVDVATADAREVLLSTGEWAEVVLTAGNETLPEALRGACIILRDTIMETTTIRATDPAIHDATNTRLAGLVAAGVLTADTKGRLMALADRPQSWAEANDFPNGVTARDVGVARGHR